MISVGTLGISILQYMILRFHMRILISHNHTKNAMLNFVFMMRIFMQKIRYIILSKSTLTLKAWMAREYLRLNHAAPLSEKMEVAKTMMHRCWKLEMLEYFCRGNVCVCVGGGQTQITITNT